MGLENYKTYKGVKGIIQTFISTKGFNIQDIYYLVDEINQFLVERNIHRCKVLPNKNVPREYNITTLPMDRFNHLKRGL